MGSNGRARDMDVPGRGARTRVSAEELKAIPLFSWLDSLALELVAGQMRKERYRKGSSIFGEGEPYETLDLLASGRAKLLRRSQGREQILGVIESGEVLEATPLFDGGPHVMTAETMGPAVVFRLAKRQAESLLEAYPALRLRLLEAVATRLRQLADLVNDLAFKDVTSRLARALLEIGVRRGSRGAEGLIVELGMSQRELAALVGTSREVISRSLKRLERAGLIRSSGREVVILDQEALSTLGSGQS